MLQPLPRPPVASRYAPRDVPCGTDNNQSPPAAQLPRVEAFNDVNVTPAEIAKLIGHVRRIT
jgi:hypothetical protein